MDTVLRKHNVGVTSTLKERWYPLHSADCRCSSSGARSLPHPRFPQLLQEHALPPGPQTHCGPEPPRVIPAGVRWLWLSPALKQGWGCPQLLVDHVELASQLHPPPPRPFCTRGALWGLREEARVGPRMPSLSPVILGQCHSSERKKKTAQNLKNI